MPAVIPPLAENTARTSCDSVLPSGTLFPGKYATNRPAGALWESCTLSAEVPKLVTVSGSDADPEGATLSAVGYVVLRSTLYADEGPTFAEKTRANLAAVGMLMPRTSTVHVPVSGTSTSTCSTVLTAS